MALRAVRVMETNTPSRHANRPLFGHCHKVLFADEK